MLSLQMIVPFPIDDVTMALLQCTVREIRISIRIEFWNFIQNQIYWCHWRRLYAISAVVWCHWWQHHRNRIPIFRNKTKTTPHSILVLSLLLLLEVHFEVSEKKNAKPPKFTKIHTSTKMSVKERRKINWSKRATNTLSTHLT